MRAPRKDVPPPPALIIELAQHIKQQNIEHVTGAILALGARAGVELLCDLFVNADATHMRRDGQAHLGNACDGRRNQVYFTRFARAKVDLHRLPGSRLVLNRNFEAHRVRHFHLVNLWFQTEGEGIEPQLQDFFEFADAFRSIAGKPEIEIFSGAGGAGETQLHRYSPFEEVAVDYAAFDGLFQHTAKRKKRDPSPQAFLVEALLACYTGKNLLETLCGLCGQAVACAFWVRTCWLSCRVSRCSSAALM